MSKRIMVFGADQPDEALAPLITQFGALVHAAGSQCLVGSSGKIGPLLAESGVPCHWYCAEPGFQTLKPKIRPASMRDFYTLMERLLGSMRGQYASGSDLLQLNQYEAAVAFKLFEMVVSADAYAFFPCGVMEYPYLFTAIMHAVYVAEQAEKPKPKQFALIGWPIAKITGLSALFNFSDPLREWFYYFPAEHIDLAVGFLHQEP